MTAATIFTSDQCPIEAQMQVYPLDCRLLPHPKIFCNPFALLREAYSTAASRI